MSYMLETQDFLISQGSDMRLIKAAFHDQIQPTLPCIATMAASYPLSFRWDVESCLNLKHSFSFWECLSEAPLDAYMGYVPASCCYAAAYNQADPEAAATVCKNVTKIIAEDSP